MPQKKVNVGTFYIELLPQSEDSVEIFSMTEKEFEEYEMRLGLYDEPDDTTTRDFYSQFTQTQCTQTQTQETNFTQSSSQPRFWLTSSSSVHSQTFAALNPTRRAQASSQGRGRQIWAAPSSPGGWPDSH